jgi:hypothetical protein
MVEPMWNEKIRLAKLHPARQEIVDSPARFKVLACGRRFGKTMVAVDTICDRLLDGKSTAYFAPTYRMGLEVWQEVCDRMRPVTTYLREQVWRLDVLNGGVFECWSLANNAAKTVRGRKYHYVVVDEAALFPSADVWHGAIRPLLTDYEGSALFCSTPKGRNWFWHLFLQGQSGDYEDWKSWRYPTGMNPHIKAEEIEAAGKMMPERFFRQEYEAAFLDDGGVVFRNIERVCVGMPVIYPTPAAINLTPRPPLHFVERGSLGRGAAYPDPDTWRGESEWRERVGYEGDDRYDPTPDPSPNIGRGEDVGGYGVGSVCFGVDWGKDNDFTCVSVMTRDGKQVFWNGSSRSGGRCSAGG